MKYLIASLFLLCLMGSNAQANVLALESSPAFTTSRLDVQNPTDRSHGGAGSENQSGRSGGSGDSSPGDGGHGQGHGGGSVPINSPEPITMIALLGGAAAAGSLSRRRKQKEQI